MSSNQLYCNNASSTLAVAIQPTDTTFSLVNASAFLNPTEAGKYILVTLESNGVREIIKVSSISGNTLTVFGGLAGRAQEGTIASGFPVGAYVEARVTAGTLASFLNTINYLPKLTSVDEVLPPSLMSSVAYVAGVDDGGMPNLTYAVTNTFWGFPGYRKITVGSGITTSGTTTSASIINTLSTATGKYIIQFTTGANQGYCRSITTSDSTSIGWSTALPNAVGTDSYEIYQSNFSIITSLSDNEIDITPFRSSGLTNLLHPSSDGMYRDVYRSGWLPSGFNQQWGGAQWGAEMQDAATGVTHKFTVATGNISADSGTVLGKEGTYSANATGFTLSEPIVVSEVWVKLAKIGNPTDSISFQIWNATGGLLPDTANIKVTFAPISNKVVTSKEEGEWYRITCAPTALNANTLYYLYAGRVGDLDATNYYTWKSSYTTCKYPGGKYANLNSGTWTAYNSSATCFLIAGSASTSVIQSSGKFDKKFNFNESAYLPVQSRSLCQPLANFFDGSNFTYLLRGDSFQKGKPICDFLYGLDHDRVVLTTDISTGVGVLTLYTAAGGVFTVNGTSDLSTTAFKDVAIIARTKGDLGDYLQLWVNGVMQDQVSGSAFVMDPLMRELGTAWVGGGFPLAPNWNVWSLNNFNTLPSAQGWTWVGTATEANAMSVSGGKLFQNKAGYGSTDTGYYTKTSAGFSNSAGWTVKWKGRVSNSRNTSAASTFNIQVYDGTKNVSVFIQEYFLQSFSTAVDFTIQNDFKNQEHTVILSGKGSDYYLWIDGKLAIDGTGKLTTTTSNNQIFIGDTDAVDSENADVVYSSIKYSTVGAILPQASTGASLSEAAFWSGDKSKNLSYLYKIGDAVSAKVFCGLSNGYVGEGVVQKNEKYGTVSNFTTSSPTPILVTDMESFIFGSKLSYEVYGMITGSLETTGGTVYPCIDGKVITTQSGYYAAPTAGWWGNALVKTYKSTFIGLHKQEARMNLGGAGSTSMSSRYCFARAES